MSGQSTVRVLEIDPELGLRIPAAQVSKARESLVAPLRVLRPGVDDVARDAGADGGVGELVVEGLLARNLLVAGNTSTELLGEGDFIQPWLLSREDGMLPHKISWHVVTPVTLAVLDAQFTERVVRWPQVTAALLERSLRRAHRMAIHQALLELTPVETRLLLLFWHLAERWGRVTPKGVVVNLELTHQLLSQMVGCQRASVTTAMKQLLASGRVQRQSSGAWVLTEAPPDELARIRWNRERDDEEQPAEAELAS